MKQVFEWYPPKAEANWRNHGVTFEQGAKAIGDKFAIEWIDDRKDYGEERINLLGMCDGVLLHVTYTERDDRIWIISTRRAERHEQDYYFRENSV
ncbi:MAG: BrnT family toxin [Magnetococcales bacterium]|nr:BrnT family toxin [Magnetococcales bacterium]